MSILLLACVIILIGALMLWALDDLVSNPVAAYICYGLGVVLITIGVAILAVDVLVSLTSVLEGR